MFGPELAEKVLSIAIPTHGAKDIRVRRSCGQRLGTSDLYTMFFESSTRRLDAAWIWMLRVHLQVSLFIWRVDGLCFSANKNVCPLDASAIALIRSIFGPFLGHVHLL